MEKSWNLTNKFLILMNQRRYAAACQTPTNMYVDIEVDMEYIDHGHGKVMEFCREDFVATLLYLQMTSYRLFCKRKVKKQVKGSHRFYVSILTLKITLRKYENVKEGRWKLLRGSKTV